MAGLKNIMLVEDDTMIIELYTTALARGEYNVQTATSAEELYGKLAGYSPDCVLLDLMLPGTSGLEILSELRNNPKYGCQQAKIVMLTNMYDPGVKEKAIEGGADGYVIKAEILPKDLLTLIPSLADVEPATTAQTTAPSVGSQATAALQPNDSSFSPPSNDIVNDALGQAQEHIPTSEN